MTNQSQLTDRRHRRGQKQKLGTNQSTSTPRKLKLHPVNSHADALTQQIRRLDRAKRRVRTFNKVALCVATLCVGNNIFNILSKRRSHNRGGGGGGGSSVLGEAFQSSVQKIRQ
eukprot:CAMPEP_0183711106 /NCGR_PEP_ID=MMETSP0737-20130205/6691_1 /TAXON_ID=385413 /ORGANISM="Thalassiosira miniscula, Strain CCMP1093" /LENGTH=113 /DNA_ID=CAMNT_0025939533 /DNA_START=90 /DNA_END=428 /DNA_ORIENTATION=+